MKNQMIEKVIVGIGDWGNPPHHSTRHEAVEIEPQNKYLLRECLGCGREVLTLRQKLCDECKKKNRKKTYRNAYYKKTRNG